MIWVRSALFNTWFFLVTLVLGLVGIPLRWLVPGGALRLAQFWSRQVLWGARWICGVRLEVSGREHLPPSGAALIASQHQSAFDTIIWLQLVPKVSYVFKAELARTPLFGPLLVPAGQIPVVRGGGAAALNAFLEGGQRAVNAGRQIVLFPEGTRNDSGGEVRLRPGIVMLAKKTGLPIFPVATDSGALWGRKAFLKVPGIVHVMIAPALDATGPVGGVLTAIQHQWRALHRDRDAVDNSVHQSPVP